MASFASRGDRRSASEPPVPLQQRHNKKGTRDSISELNLPSIRSRHLSFSSSITSSHTAAAANRKQRKANQLFGESFDPSAHQNQPKKQIPKSEQSREILAHSLLSHFLFSRLEDDELITLVDAMEERKFQAGEAVITQGDYGDYFYVVEAGSFQIIVDDVHVGNVEGVGGTFGELALMHNSPRAATVKAVEDALLWGLDRTTFKSLLASTSNTKFNDVKEFLGKVKMLEGLEPSQMSTLAQAVDVKKYQSGETIVSKGDQGSEMFVIKEGTVVCKVIRGANEKDDEDGNSRVGSMKTMNVSLGSGDYFGERALM